MNKSIFLQEVWARMCVENYSAERLSSVVASGLGVDMSGLTLQDLVDLIDGTFAGEWTDVSFSFSALLAKYSVLAQIENEHIVAWIFAVGVMAECVKRRATSWEEQLNFVLDGLANCGDKLESEERVRVLKIAFCESDSAFL